MKRLTLEIDSDLGSVSLVSLAIKAICLHAGLSAPIAGQVELSIVEAITNSIRHAYHGERNHLVTAVVSVDEQLIQLEILDSGTSMSAEQVKKLLSREDFAETEIMETAMLPEGGRGLQIIRRVMDEIAYVRDGAHNRLILLKRIRAD